MDSGFISSRLMRTFICAFLVILCGISQASLRGSGEKPTRTLWEKKLTDEILAVVNPDAARTTLRGPDEEDVVLMNSPADVGFGQSPFQLLGNSSGVLLLAARDKSKFVQLIALDVDTGEKLWQIPCTALPSSELFKNQGQRTTQILSSLMADRNQVAVLQQPDGGKSGSNAPRILVSYDLRTGAELWRSGASGIDFAQMLTQMGSAKQKGLAGWAMRRAMKDINKMISPISTYQTLPQRGLMLKASNDQAGLSLEAADLDTGQPAWTIHIDPVRSDFKEVMKTQSMRDMMKRTMTAKSQDMRPILNWIRGEYFFQGCSGAIAEAAGGTGQCSSLRAYNMSTGQLAWEFRENSQEVMGWIPAHEVVLVRLTTKIVALKLSSGEKLYEISDSRVPVLSGAFAGKPYADEDLLFWFDLNRGDNKLSAMETGSGKILWEIPTSRARVIGFIARDKTLAVGSESELVIIDKRSGEEIRRQRPLTHGPIRTVAAPDPQSIVVVGDKQIVRYTGEPWKETYRVTIPEPKHSIWGDLVHIGLAATVAAIPTYAPGPMPGTFVSKPFGTTIGGQILLRRLESQLFDQSSASLQKLERQSSNFCYFNSGGAIYRVDMATGTLEEVNSIPSKDAILALDEAHGIGCLIRNRTLSAFQMPVDEKARQTTRFLTALEVGFREIRRGSKMEANDAPKAVAAYLSSVGKLGEALAAGNELREKATVSLALGRACDRLSVLVPRDAESWKAKAGKEYMAAASLACSNDARDLQDLCRTATELADGRSQK